MKYKKDGMKIGCIDTAMVVFRAKCVNGWEFPDEYTADGQFILYLYQKYKDTFQFLKKRMAYYNKLRP